MKAQLQVAQELQEEIDKNIKESDEKRKEYFSYKKNYLETPSKELKVIMSELKLIKSTSKLKEIDVQISIAQNLISYVIALFIAFISIPSLQGNLIFPIIVIILSIAALVYLLYQRGNLTLSIDGTLVKDKINLAEEISKSLNESLDFMQGLLDTREAIIKRTKNAMSKLKKIMQK